MSTETVKFNVGGHKYEVSRSLLSSHPDTMLARSASDQWQEDAESEIFIERDGERFKYCLDYLRDGRARLPLTVSKEAVIDDLKYYGVENVNKDEVGFYPCKGAQFMQAQSCLNDEMEKAEKDLVVMKDNCKCAGADLFCIKKYIETRQLSIRYSNNQKSSQYIPLADAINKACGNITTFDECLSRFGLKFKSHKYPFSYTNDIWDLYLSKLEE